VHDGPGIRTSIFFKGCPLRCIWCSNPESLNPFPQVGVYGKSCIGLDKCSRCLHACPYQEENILIAEDGKITGIDRLKCRNCLLCSKACPNSTLKTFGEKYSVRELVKIILEDRKYYEQSGGGITLGGGDPLLQWEFVRDLFEECRRFGIHTCLETELQCAPEALESVLPYTDLLFTDIKHINPQKHKEITGVTNERILFNIKLSVAYGTQAILRTPIVPGYNDDEECIHGISSFVVRELNNKILQYQLLPFRILGKEKYAALGLQYPMGDVSQPKREDYEPNIRRIAREMCSYGVPAVAGTNVHYDHNR
jgi:pyruvate formate lyase activating enzyme